MDKSVAVLAKEAREILGTSDDADRVAEDRALKTTLATIGLDPLLDDDHRTRALYRAYKAHDDLGRIRDEIRNPGENARIGYTPEVQMRTFMEKALNLSKAAGTEHGREVLTDVLEKMAQIERLEDFSNMPESRVSAFANAHGLRIPKQLTGFLNSRANRQESVSRLTTAVRLTEEAEAQMQGLEDKGRAIAITQGIQGPQGEP